MKKMMMGGLMIAVFVATSSNVMAGGGGPGVLGATELTQLANNSELALQLTKQIKMVENLMEQLNYARENIKRRLDIFPNTLGRLGVPEEILKLVKIVKQGQALGYSMENISEVFKQRFKGYEKSENFAQDYKTWSQTSLDSIQTALASISLQANDFEDEWTVNKFWWMENQTSGGHMRVLQTANFIAGEQTVQLQKLRNVMMAQMQAQGAYMAADRQLEDNTRAAEAEFYKYRNPRGGKTYPKY